MGGVGLPAGIVVWCDLDPVVGREQGGRRPCVVISSSDFSDVVTRLVLVVPCTTRDRGWVNHVTISGPTGLASPTYALTEQVRSLSTERVRGVPGRVDDTCLTSIMRWVHVWLHRSA